MGIAMRQGREFDTHDNAIRATGGRHQRIDGASLLAERQCDRQQRDGRQASSPNRRRRRDYAYSDPANTDPQPLLFLPLAQDYYSDVIVALRSRTTASAITAQLRQAVARPRQFLAA